MPELIACRWPSGTQVFHEASSLADSANLLTLDTGAITIGHADQDVDFKIFLGAAGQHVVFDAGAATMTLTGVTAALGNLTFAAATDMTVIANTAAALEFYDATTKFFVFDTRNTVTAVANVTVTGIPATIVAASGVTHNLASLAPGTTTLTGATGVNAMQGLALTIAQPTITSASNPAVAIASSVYIEGEPAAGGTATITAPYALYVASGNSLFAGNLTFAAATDMTVIANTAAALEFYDATTKFFVFDTRNTVTAVANVTVTGIPATIVAASGVTHNLASLAPGTTTLTGATGVNAMQGLALTIAQPTITSASNPAVAIASSVYIEGEPAAGGTATITAPYALYVASGNSLFAGNLTFAAATDMTVIANTAAALEFYDATTKFFVFDTRNTVTAVANVTVTGIPATIVAASGVTHNLASLAPGTTTLTGATGVNAMQGLALTIAQPTITSASNPAVAIASSVYIAAEPAAGGTATITAPYALYVASGNSLFAGDITIVTGSKRTTAAELTFNSVDPLTIQIGGVDLLQVDEAAIAAFAAAADTAGHAAYLETEDGGVDGGAGTGRAGGLLSIKTGDGSAATTTTAVGGAGGALSLISGIGLTGNTTGNGGVGGAVAITAGAGGASGAGVGVGGTGGTITLTAGAGGGAGGGVAGVPGKIAIGAGLLMLLKQTIDMADAAVSLTLVPGTPTGTLLAGNILYVDPDSGSSENLLLPHEADCNGLFLTIVNTGGETINVQNDAGGAVLTLETLNTAYVVCDGTTWGGFVGIP